MERKLATIRKIINLEPIPDADQIEVATIDAWKVVVKKGEFLVGDLVCYFEIDSWIPNTIAAFLSKGKTPKEFEGVQGERLKTIRLKGQISQGLVLPLSILSSTNDETNINEGDDITERVGILKWEKPLPVNMNGHALGYFPTFIPKTNAERCQNLVAEIAEAFDTEEEFEITEKIDGSSMTVYTVNNTPLSEDRQIEFGVCSRNLELKTELSDDNIFVNTARDTGLIAAMLELGLDIAVQGELYGEGIQGNREKIKGVKFAVYNIFDISTGMNLLPDERLYILQILRDLGADVVHVPIVAFRTKLETSDIKQLLLAAEGETRNGNTREGVVYKSHARNFSFKAISNLYLLKTGD